MIRNRLTSALAAALAIALLAGPAARAHDIAEHALLAETERDSSSPSATQTLTGTVQAVIIDDATRGTSSRYVELRLDDGTLVPLRGELTATLKSGARVAVSGQHQGKPLEVETARIAAPAAGDITTKSTTEIDGSLAVLHADYFTEGKSEYVYEVHEPTGKINRLRLGSLPPSLAPGMHVRVTGRVEADGESVTPDRITILAVPAPASSVEGTLAKAATANRVLVIMANFNNTAAPAYTTAQAQQVMTSNADSVANFFREASYGQQLMNVTVTPSWVRMNLSQPTSCGSSNWQSIGSAAEAAARALGAAYDPSTYDFVVYLFPTVPACGWVGLAYVGSPHKAWINGVGAFRTSAIAHEMGHNFGLLHAASLRCGSGIIGGSCSASEYGDPFDTMGNQRAMHYNAMQKSKLAWIPSTSVKTHAGGSATYTLSPLELAGGATYAVKIPTTATNRTYWLEFRQPIGFDSPLSAYPNNGVQIRVSAPFETYCSGCDIWSDDTELVDMTPATSTFTDGALVAGQTFYDPTNGVHVTVVSASASALNVQVSTGGASGAPPAGTVTTLAATPNPATTGAMVTFTAIVSGNMPSGTVKFADAGSAITGCGAVNLTGTGATRSAICATTALITGTHSIVASYSGDTANAASTSTTITQTITSPVTSTNVALASNGAIASASSSHDAGYAASGAIDNRRSGANWGSGGGWNDGTASMFPDWLQINFNGKKTIDHVVVYSLQDNFPDPAEPTDSMTFTLYGLTDFQVQGWTGSAWITLGTVSANNLVKCAVFFSAYTTDRIRILVTGTKDRRWSRITEVEAWTSTATAPMTNYALASNGAIASASSSHDAGYAASGTIDNRRSGANWGSGGGWNDGTASTFPDWLQINFNGKKTINHVVVYSVQDNFRDPVEPTDSMTFMLYGLTDFQVQGWTGSAWISLGTVSANNLVKRAVFFSAYTTDRIRILVTGAKDQRWSRITEVEGWGN